MSAHHEMPDRRPWYRQLWPWLLMLPPAASIVGGVTMILLATQTPNALVVEDYARIEELTDERFVLDSVAAQLGMEAVIRFDDTRTQVELSADGILALPSSLQLHMQHASNPDADRDFTLERVGERYIADGEIAPGRYHVQVVPDDAAWRLAGTIPRLGVQRTLVLTAQHQSESQAPASPGRE